jgi:peptidyl-tRNA hydrolase, PTH1 family
MLIIQGLGNNDSKYLQTKHNAGRLVLESLASLNNLSFQKKDKFWWVKTEVNSEPVYFFYSDGYMNLSGESMLSFFKYFKLKLKHTDRVLILQDDSDQLSGSQKLLQAGGTAGHRGIENIYKYLLNLDLNLEQIWRFKIGIRPQGNTGKSEHFVLSRCSTEELAYFDVLASKLQTLIFEQISDNWGKVQEILNQKTR